MRLFNKKKGCKKLSKKVDTNGGGGQSESGLDFGDRQARRLQVTIGRQRDNTRKTSSCKKQQDLYMNFFHADDTYVKGKPLKPDQEIALKYRKDLNDKAGINPKRKNDRATRRRKRGLEPKRIEHKRGTKGHKRSSSRKLNAELDHKRLPVPALVVDIRDDEIPNGDGNVGYLGYNGEEKNRIQQGLKKYDRKVLDGVREFEKLKRVTRMDKYHTTKAYDHKTWVAGYPVWLSVSTRGLDRNHATRVRSNSGYKWDLYNERTKKKRQKRHGVGTDALTIYFILLFAIAAQVVYTSGPAALLYASFKFRYHGLRVLVNILFLMVKTPLIRKIAQDIVSSQETGMWKQQVVDHLVTAVVNIIDIIVPVMDLTYIYSSSNSQK
mmetsp:Transcript_951/g.1232  ORF Transcript_951/g.1232 Transcript_951/m.1232 type:complete len:380 (-) Transcript_951:169-1308(-)|eukprot:CAMPEP_0204867476 /NCGR_PEP_ID=MMETSP1348-20121228/22963_1 /ASSEMBLY_ACC=CAM_ASM_000700 /TAXON_ID=215587 /ORGANISM="Aplanochytrium stocchinoi, Strain GSBS06" /LENGTH=379 /DNA_ID=CAMNT_0052019939 /DNA_START=231 /DNA_END=1370 /DNA_ORIENTATION=-